MKTGRAQCAIFWLLSGESMKNLIKYQHANFKTKINKPLAPNTSSNWEEPESPEDIEKIMQEAARHVRRVD